MNYLKLSKRLAAIADMVPCGSLTADIGTDHAFLPIYLIKNGVCEHCIASDIVDGPLQIARKNIQAAGLSDKIQIIKSDGLVKVFPFTPETIIIAGMGGETIRDIISACEYSKNASPLFILQPMTHSELLREYLHTNSFCITEEKVIRQEHRFYVILKAQYAQKGNSLVDTKKDLDTFYELGNIMPDCDEHKDYLLWKKQTLEQALSGLNKSGGLKDKAEKINKIILEIDRRLK